MKKPRTEARRSSLFQKFRSQKPEESDYFKDAADSIGHAQDASNSIVQSQTLTEPSHSIIEPPGAQSDEPWTGESTPLEKTAQDAPADAKKPSSPSSPSAQTADFSASERMMSGVSWSALSVVFNQVLFLIKSIVLARLLTPETFGLMGMSTTVHGALNAFTNLSLTNIIVSGKFEDDDDFKSQLDTIWTVEIIRRAFVTALIMALSYPIAIFYKNPLLAPILAISCMTLFVKGFENVGLKTLQRDVKWKQATIYGMTSTALVSVAVMLVALWRQDVWALAWGQFAASIVSVALSYIFHPYRPRFKLARTAMKRSAVQGRWFMVIGIMVYITTTVDNVFIGRMLGSAALGGYIIAYTISTIPQTILSRVISSVLFPIVAALNRNDDVRLGPAISRVMNVSTSMLALIMVPMAVLAPELIGTFYGSKWQDSAEPLRILLLPGLFRGLLQNIGPIMLGLNRPDLEARSKIAEAILFVLALSLLVPSYGIIGAAWASALAYFLAVVLRYRNAIQLVPDGFKNLPLQLFSMTLAALGGAGAGFLILWPLTGAAPLLRLLVGAPVVWGVTGVLLLALRPELHDELKSFKRKAGLGRFAKRA